MRRGASIGFVVVAAVLTAAQAGWQACFEKQSRWVMTWARSVRAADVRLAGCEARVAVAPSVHPEDWWLWWVPLRHIGGQPYTYVRLEVPLDRARCRLQSERGGR